MIDFNCKCFYCERIFNVAPYGSNTVLIATRDHIVPISRGGDSAKTNLVDACVPCNTYKGSFLLEDFMPKVEGRIEKGLGWGGISFERLHLVVKNAKVLLANDSKNPNPRVVTIIEKKRTKKSFYYSADVHLSVNSNTSRSKFFEEAERQKTIRELLDEPEPNFHYL